MRGVVKQINWQEHLSAGYYKIFERKHNGYSLAPSVVSCHHSFLILEDTGLLKETSWTRRAKLSGVGVKSCAYHWRNSGRKMDRWGHYCPAQSELNWSELVAAEGHQRRLFLGHFCCCAHQTFMGLDESKIARPPRNNYPHIKLCVSAPVIPWRIIHQCPMELWVKSHRGNYEKNGSTCNFRSFQLSGQTASMQLSNATWLHTSILS